MKITCKVKGLKMPKTIFRKKKFGGFILPDFKNYYKTKVIKVRQDFHTDKRIDQWVETESKK